MPSLLGDALRGDVVRARSTAITSSSAQRLAERARQDRPRRLGRQPAAPRVRREVPADLDLRALHLQRLQAAVAEQLAGRAVLQREHREPARGLQRDLLVDRPVEVGGQLRADPALDVRVRVDRLQRLDVGGRDRPQAQALGLDQERGRRHGASPSIMRSRIADDLGARDLRVLGARDVERALVERPDQDVGQRRRGLGRDQPRVDPGLDRPGDEPEPVAQPDRPPALPAQDGGRVEQDDPLDLGLGADGQERAGAGAQRGDRVGRAAERLGGDPLRRPRLDLLEDRLEQLLLVLELVVERAAGDARVADDLLGPDRRVAALAEEAAGGLEQRPAGDRRALDLLVGGLEIHTACM